MEDKRKHTDDYFDVRPKVVYRKQGEKLLHPRKRKRLFKLDVRKSKDNKLTLQEEMFCRYYSSDTEFFGDGFQSCAAAFNYDIMDKSEALSCKYKAAGLLRSQRILKRINEFLRYVTLNDAHVDKQLGFLITQNADFGNKLGAIKEYNKLQQRITERIKIEEAPRQITKINIVSLRDLLGNDPEIFNTQGEGGTDDSEDNQS